MDFALNLSIVSPGTHSQNPVSPSQATTLVEGGGRVRFETGYADTKDKEERKKGRKEGRKEGKKEGRRKKKEERNL